MLRAGGYATVTEGDGRLSREEDTATCAHGNEIVRIAPGHVPKHINGDDIDYCCCCKGLLCQKCAAEMNLTLKCVPFEKRLEEMESRHRFRRALTG